jgi:WXXGXW repeat (2 copies)
MRKYWLRSLIPALSLAALPVLPTVSHAGIAVGVSINVAPPALPVYVQPPLPAPGYMWTPGYWAYGDEGYYWVPGTWVQPPSPGVLWTPGYWGWGGGVYAWHAGYWGPHIGFYGGVNYGFGYGGVGFEGGYWRGGAFFYNRAAVNVGGVHITNVYNRTIINNVNHVAFNGPGGIQARATAHELAAEHEHHFEATSMQRDHEHAAAGNRELRASFNHGRPAVAATARPGEFSGRGVVAAHGSGPHGGPAPQNHGAPGGGHPVARNDMHEGGHPGGSPGGGAPHGNPGGGAPHPGGNGGGHPNPGGGGHPAAAPSGHPGGGGHPNPSGNHKPEGHR